jgi:uncharacterized protein (DUF1800 family)
VGFWWKPSNPTWGLSIQQQGQHSFAVWFTYNAQNKPVWYALTCAFVSAGVDKNCVGDLVTGTGIPFANLTGSANAQFTAAGSGSLKLTAQGTLELRYAIGGVQQHITDLERLNLVAAEPVPVCFLQAGSRVNANNYTDLWWGGATASGWGIHISHQSNQLFLSWASYDAQGNATWMVGLGSQDPADNLRFSGNLFQFAQGVPYSQATAALNPPAAVLGTFDLNFSNGEQGHFNYSLPDFGVSQRTLPLERFAAPGLGDVTLCNVTPPFSAAQQAARFLSQATFGAKMADIEALVADGSDYAAWLDQQFAKPQSRHLPSVRDYLLSLPLEQRRGKNPAFSWSMWKNFASADDQLRQRVAFALSEIMVISLDGQLKNYPLGPAHYLDTLGEQAFGNYRDLLNAVTYSPMMGLYLNALHNQKEDTKTGRVPDENYAREVMQLFTIGLYKLNLDGSPLLDATSKPIETYSNADITGLARVFTGLSWAGPDTSSQRFFSARRQDYESQIQPMQAYNQFHSVAEKRFLTASIPAQKNADTEGDVRIALDTLFNHPNVGPFIGKQLIQRLVSSNPTPAYVARVARAFNNNGQGARGDMRAVIKAILLDPEARDQPMITAQSGKLREPVLRFVQWLRSFNALSANGAFLLDSTARADTQLAQSPLLAPSVFNFFRPGYVPPNSRVGDAGLVAPEAQITTETSVAGYLNFMRTVINTGVGSKVGGSADIQADYSAELALASEPDQLIARVSLLLATDLSSATRTLIRDAVASVSLATNTESNKLNRVKLAIYLVMASPEYIVQN